MAVGHVTRVVSGEVLERLLPYVPSYWAEQALAHPGHTLVGRQDRLPAAVLFCDISGFTPIAEALSRRGREGIEELTALLDRYLGAMSAQVVALGGQVIKFAGDSLLALFPRADAGETHLGSALSCALHMRQAISEFARLYTSAGTFPVQAKIGISEGPVYTTTVGDEENGMLPVFAGRTIVRAMLAEDHADAGEIVVDARLIRRLPGHLDVGEARGTFRLIDGATNVPVLPAAQPIDLSTLDAERVERLVRCLSPYLASQSIERIYHGSRGVYGEYRRVTVMFVRFEGLDYDASLGDGVSVGEALQVYFASMRDCIMRHGGRLNEVDITVNGGVLVALFGAPTAHEDDELRAVSCAWEMQRVLANVRSIVGQRPAGQAISDLRQCVGISSGVLFAGDVGSEVRRTYAVVGDEVNLASRLSNMAGWDETLVTSWVRWRSAGRFEFEAKGEVAIRGKAERVPLCSLRAPRALGEGSRLLARLLNRPFLIGRTSEMEAMEAVSVRARQGEPQLLILSGEAGVGKSRLAGELVYRWSQLGGTVYAAECARGYGAGSGRPDIGRPGPAISDLRRCHIGQQRARRGGSTAHNPWIALLNAALHLQDGDVAEQRRRSWVRALERLVQTAAPIPPLLLVLEGVHQLDPDVWAWFREWMGALPGTGGPAMPLLVCATCRPTGEAEPEGPTSQGASIRTTRLLLEPLAEADSFYLAQHLLRDVGLQVDLAPALVRQARGNPLYLREMVRSLASSECPLEALSRGLIVPDRIADTVLAQLDPLGPDFKLTLCIAAVIGQTFSLRLLQAAHPVPISRHDLAVRLARLERMHMVRLYHMAAGGDPPDLYYRFRHALAQQVIYASLLRADRERLHRGVGCALEQVSGETPYGLLAEHFQKGDVLPKAIVYALLAGRSAAGDRAVREAMVYYGWAEDLLLAYEASVPAARLGRCVQGVRISLLLGRARVHLQLLDVVQAREDYEQALDLAGALADVKSQADALLNLGGIAMRQADYIGAQTLIYQAIQHLSVLDEPDLLARAQLELGRISALRGGLAAAAYCLSLAADVARRRPELEWTVGRAVRAYSEWLGTVFVIDRTAPAWGGQDAGARSGGDLECLLWRAEVAMQRGNWGRAFGLARRAMALGWASGTRLDVADAKRVLAWLLMQAGAYPEAGEHIDEALATFAEAEWTTGLADGYWLSGEICLALGKQELAAERFEQALTLGQETHTIGAIVRAQIGLGKLAAARGQWWEGQRLCTEARARAVRAKLVCAISARLALAYVHLGCQQWLLAHGQAEQALDLGCRLGFPGQVLDAACILGQASAEMGQVERAREHFGQACRVAVQLADTLPLHYARAFWSKPCVGGPTVQLLRDRMDGQGEGGFGGRPSVERSGAA